jgi:mannosyl-oligosaccharide alpha-1,2-mannosidase
VSDNSGWADLQVADAIIENLLYVTPDRGMLYVTDTSNGVPSHKFEHLSCFLPGLLALGAHTLGLSPTAKQHHFWAAQGLAYSCWITYADQATGLGPDEILMTPFADAQEGKWTNRLHKWEAQGSYGFPPGLSEYPPQRKPEQRDYTTFKPKYLLRPEVPFFLHVLQSAHYFPKTIESFYILWKTTGDVKWRERGWYTDSILLCVV